MGSNPTVRAKHVLILAAFLFLWNTWGYDLAAPDEPYFAEGAREMVVDGQWAVPHVNGVVTTDKPPLFFWLIALVSLPVGKVGSVTARLPSALAMFASTALVMRLGRRLIGESAAPLAGLVFVTTYLVWDKGRTSQIDALLCLLIVVQLSVFEAFRAGDSDGRRAGLLFWAAAGLATLAKGPVGFAVPVVVAVATLAFDGNLKAWGRFAPFAGPALFLGIVAAWMALATVGGHGEYSVWGAIQKHVLSRALHGMHHKQPFWYYAQVLPVQLVPWTALVPAAAVAAYRMRRPSDRFLLVWAAFVVLFFSIPVEKRDLYVLPAYPAFALLVARLVEGIEAGTAPIARRAATVPHGILSALCVIVGLAAPFLVARKGYMTVAQALIPSFALAAGGAAALFFLRRGQLRRAVLGTIAGTALAYLTTSTIVFPLLDSIRSARNFSVAMAEASAESRKAGHPVLAFDVGNLPEAFAFYSNGVYTKTTSEPADLAQHLASPDRVLAVVDEHDLPVLSEAQRAGLVVLRREQLGGKHIVLVANR